MESATDVKSWALWLETQGPLWVMYLAVMVLLFSVGRMGYKLIPILFEKHCTMLDTATESMAKSANAITSINDHVSSNRDKLNNGQRAIAKAAVPACKAIMELTPPEKAVLVRSHLDDVVRILSEPVKEER